MARRVASGLAGLASAARLHLARGSAVLRGAGARVAEPDRPVGEASRRSAPASGEDEDGPLRWYRRRVREGALRADARQVEALERLQDLRSRLAAPRGALLGREHAPWRLGADDVGVFGSHDGATTEPRSQGVYLHGGVGRGKTMLMDAFFATLPRRVKERARRVHFHAFMAETHARLHALSDTTTRVRFAPDGTFFNLETSNDFSLKKKKAGPGHSTRDPSSDPLALVAARIVSESPLVCFDEVELSDIADALVFKRVFEKVFERGGALVATSNAAPEALYDGGINRAAFAPFAKELERRTRVVSLDASAAVAEPERGLDHRRVNRAGEAARRAPTAGREFGFGEDSRGDDERRRFADEGASPPPSVAAGARSVLVVAGETGASSRSEAQSDAMDGAMDVLLETWRAATTGTETRDVSIRVAAGRSLRVPAARGRGCRFSFRDLFGQEARLGVADYAALLARYDVVCVDTVVPTFAAEKDEDALRRFVNFVDVAYENKTLLVAATARAPEELLVTDRSYGDDQSDRLNPIDSTQSFSTRARVRLEGTRGAFALAESGGASGRSAPMVGDMEWSATGRGGAALADLQATNFTFRAAARCVSRLVEMGGEAYEAAWWEEERARRRLERGSGDEAR
jgi:cell division protein ZapE